MSPEELLNLALQHEVEIEPHTTIKPKRFLTFDFKGCAPLKIARVPLYVAMHLKSLNLCTIKALPYFSRDFLVSLIEKEKRGSNFIELPDYFFELSHYFKTHEIESLLCELKRIRRNKVWQGLRILDGRGLCINGITRWEFNEFREFILGSLEFGKKIEGN